MSRFNRNRFFLEIRLSFYFKIFQHICANIHSRTKFNVKSGLGSFMISLFTVAMMSTWALASESTSASDSEIAESYQHQTSNHSQEEPKICMAVLLKTPVSEEAIVEKWYAMMLSQISQPMRIKVGQFALEDCMQEKPETLIIMAHTISLRSSTTVGTPNNAVDFSNLNNTNVNPKQSKRVLVNEYDPNNFKIVYNIDLQNLVRKSGLKNLYFQSCSWQFLFSQDQLNKYKQLGIRISGARPKAEDNYDQSITNFITDIPDYISELESM